MVHHLFSLSFKWSISPVGAKHASPLRTILPRRFVFSPPLHCNGEGVGGRGKLLLIALLLTLFIAGNVSAQVSGAVALLGAPTVNDDQVTVKLTVKNANGLPALNLSAENFSLSEDAQDKQLTAASTLPITMAVIVDLSHGSDVDLIQDALRAYFAQYYQPDDHITFYILGTSQSNSEPEVVEPASLKDINTLIDGLKASPRFYSISKALSESLDKLQSLQSADQPAHALYIGSFLNDPSEANQSTPFKLAGIPLHVVQAHRYRHPSTPALQKLAANGGGLFADDLSGTSVLDGSTPVNLVKTIYDVIAASRTVYTLSYRSLNQSLEARRTVTVTVALSSDVQASADFSYERTFQAPEVTMISANLTPVRLPSRQGNDVSFDVSRQPVTVSVSFPDGVVRKIASLRLEVLDANTGNTLQSSLEPAPDPDSTGNYVINWALDDFKNPGTTSAVEIKVTATDELGLSGDTSAKGSITVGALPPLPTPTAAPTETLAPTTTALSPTVTLIARATAVNGAASGVAALQNGVVSLPVVIGIAGALVVIILLLLIGLLRVRRHQAEREEELEALRDQPIPVPYPAQAAPASPKASTNGSAEEEEEKTVYGRLVVIDGLEDKEILLDQEEFIIGRRAESGCHYVIDQPFISPRHCMIISHEGSYAIRDLNTKNGTFVNGERIPRERDVVVPIGSEVGITERIKLELWDPFTVVNLETRRAGQTDVRTTTRVNTSAADVMFQPLPGIRYADDDETEIEDDYSPF
jgi:pSer/pThr/pTyr-binding forkhead associated (FHA) protein